MDECVTVTMCIRLYHSFSRILERYLKVSSHSLSIVLNMQSPWIPTEADLHKQVMGTESSQVIRASPGPSCKTQNRDTS